MQCPQNTHILASVTPTDAHMFSRPWEGTCALRALWGGLGRQTSREIGCIKHASDQIQPTASDLSSRNLQVPSFREAPWSPAPLCPCLALPRCLFPQGCSLEVRGLVKVIFTLRQCPEGHGRASHQPSGLLGAQTWEPVSQRCLHRDLLHGPEAACLPVLLVDGTGLASG